MSYAISILRRAQKELANLPSRDYERVRDAFMLLLKIQDHLAVSS